MFNLENCRNSLLLANRIKTATTAKKIVQHFFYNKRGANPSGYHQRQTFNQKSRVYKKNNLHKLKLSNKTHKVTLIILSLKSLDHLELFFRANDDAVISTHVGAFCTFVLNFKRCRKWHCIAVDNTYADDWGLVLQPNFFS